MPLYECTRCHMVDNTALGDYWGQKMTAFETGCELAAICSKCLTGTWHGKFPRLSADGMIKDRLGFLWRSVEEIPHNLVCKETK